MPGKEKMVETTDIRALVWDFDGTFYRPDARLFDLVRKAEIRVITTHKQVSFDQAERLFYQHFKVNTASATEAVAQIVGIPTSQAAQEMEEHYDRRSFLNYDDRLVKLFKSLSHLQHVILANGIRQKIIESLEVLGVPLDTFKEIVTSETVGVNKPNSAGYAYVLKRTGLLAAQHCMVGDRPVVDLETAKKMGMQTCLVWSDERYPYVDVSLPDVYSVETLVSQLKSRG